MGRGTAQSLTSSDSAIIDGDGAWYLLRTGTMVARAEVVQEGGVAMIEGDSGAVVMWRKRRRRRLWPDADVAKTKTAVTMAIQGQVQVEETAAVVTAMCVEERAEAEARATWQRWRGGQGFDATVALVDLNP